jgi:multiple sugar transport system substrate-binding protein
VVLLLIAACGSAATPGASGTAGPQGAAVVGPGASAIAAEGGAAGGPVTPGETATVAVQGPTAVTLKPTGVPEVACQADQKTLVWMVRNGPVENPWEANIVRPAFQKAHPEICLKILSINQDDIAVKREAMIAAGEQLDVWSTNWGGDGFASDRARGLITDLTPLIQKDKFDTSVFIPDVLKVYQSEGKQWGLPFLTTGSYVYYNKKMFDDAKIPYPPVDWDDTSWTWQKFVDTAKKLTKNVGDINKAQYGANYAVLNLEGPPAMWGHDIWPEDAYTTGFADKITVTDDKSVAAFQAFHDLVYKDKVAPDPAASQALDQLGGAFASGRMAMTMSGGWGHWSWKALIDDPSGFCWGAAPLPMGTPDAKMRTVLYTDPWVITRNLKPDQEERAWTFVKFLVSPEQAAAYTKATGTPPTQTALLNDYYQQFAKCMKPEDMKKVFEGAFTHGRESSNHLMVKWDTLNQIWTNNLDPYWSDANADTKTVLKTVEDQTNQQLSQIKATKGK